MKITDIVIGERFRKDMGDLQALADSIAAEGLLQPVGVTETNDLVFGQRRLRACELLGWTDIPSRVVHVSSILAGEYAENTLRKDFTVSERVAIAEAVRLELGERRGGDQSAKSDTLPLTGRKTREIAAERAGFGGHTTFAKAKRVIDHGVPELVDAMDSGVISIHAAHAVAALPPSVQREVIAEDRVVETARMENRPNGRRDTNPMSTKAHYKHPLIKLENIAMTLETAAEAMDSLDLKRAADIPVERMARCTDRITEAMKQIRHSLNALQRLTV